MRKFRFDHGAIRSTAFALVAALGLTAGPAVGQTGIDPDAEATLKA